MNPRPASQFGVPGEVPRLWVRERQGRPDYVSSRAARSRRRHMSLKELLKRSQYNREPGVTPQSE